MYTVLQDSQGNALEYQASSPDEVALASHAAVLGLRLTERDRTRIRLEIIGGANTLASLPSPMGHCGSEEWEILHEFPFESGLQRMGIVLRHAVSH